MALAETQGVCTRTLRNWQQLDPEESATPPGRPRLSQQKLEEARRLVLGQLDRQGWSAGEEPIWRGLQGSIPRARVRRVLRELKAAHRQRRRRVRAETRTSTRVEFRDAIWAVDATHVGRDADGVAMQAEVVREIASTRTLAVSVGRVAIAQDVITLLERLARVRGGLPLVLMSDNGAAYRSNALRTWCRAHRVVQLFSLPKTPQHNGACEHGMRDIKSESALDNQAPVIDTRSAMEGLVHTIQRIDRWRPRKTRGWKTAVESDEQAPSWRSAVSRRKLYAAVTCATSSAVLHSKTKRAERKAIREAILSTLQRFSIITRTRGGRPWTAQSAESDS